ncbi:MAG: 30S ribosomal protein S16 [Coriobacteriia bacterium]
MAVKIRLARAGAHKAPFYRLVAADSRSPRDGRFIEILGRYNPRTEPSTIEIDLEKVDAWIAKGAQMTETASKLVNAARNPEAAAPAKTGKVSKKQAAKAAADADAKAKAAAEAKEAKEAAKAAAEAPAEEPAAEEAPAEEAAAEEAPAEEPAAEEAPAEEAAAEDAPAEDAE